MPFEQRHLNQLSKSLLPLTFFDLIKIILTEQKAICISTHESELWLHKIIAKIPMQIPKDHFIYGACGITDIHIECSKEMHEFLFSQDGDETPSRFYLDLTITIKRYIQSHIIYELEPQKKLRGSGDL